MLLIERELRALLAKCCVESGCSVKVSASPHPFIMIPVASRSLSRAFRASVPATAAHVSTRAAQARPSHRQNRHSRVKHVTSKRCPPTSSSALRSDGSLGNLSAISRYGFVFACGSEHFSSQYGTRAANPFVAPSNHLGCQSSAVIRLFFRARARPNRRVSKSTRDASASTTCFCLARSSRAHLEKLTCIV